MSRRSDAGDVEEAAFNRPFRDLKKAARLAGLEPAPSAHPAPSARGPKLPPPAAAEDDGALFRQAVKGVKSIGKADRAPAPPPRPPRSHSLAERDETEALAALSDLVAGSGEFDISDTEEHVEGMVVGLDPRTLRRLRAGEFAYQAHVDLHGMTADEARPAVRQFMLRALRAGHRCVLVVHGRGLNSRDRRPVLKDALKGWLIHGELARVVMAFSSARPHDGGSGAMYVLLRRERRAKQPFRTYDGVKSP